MLKDKIIIVTGGSGLIGQAIVDDLRKHNAIVFNAEISVETDLKAGTIHCDITKTDSIDTMLKLLMETYGTVDGLVNNAYPRTSDWGNKFEDITMSSWQKNVDMQLNSVFYLCQQTFLLMKNKKSGSIVNVASIYGIVGNDFTVYNNTGGMTSPAAYAAIKGGVINFTRYLAAYFGPYNVRANCVSPGGIFNHQNENFVENFNNKVPLGRMGLPEDIAPAITFLLSDGAKYITGHNLVVDGGWTAI
jgi:NAD(P)-dependent dehydrogenase (short-subunit alcohol dehydrogenase family)